MFFRNLFGSRLSAHLEEEIYRVRELYEARILERERTIAELRERNADLSSKVDRYELVLLPLTSPMGDFFKQKKESSHFQTLTEDNPLKSWEEMQRDFYAKQEKELAEETAAREAQ
jgi:hypothetical protein